MGLRYTQKWDMYMYGERFRVSVQQARMRMQKGMYC